MILALTVFQQKWVYFCGFAERSLRVKFHCQSPKAVIKEFTANVLQNLIR